VLRTVWLAAALAALLFPASVLAGRTSREIMPGVAYIRESRQAYGGPLVLHMLLGPRPGGLYAVKPVLSNELVTGRETVTSMQRRLSRRATLAGVNGDFFGWSMGYPSGMYLRNNVLATGPLRMRSSLGIDADGLLRIGRVSLAGTWRAEGAELGRRLSQFNRPLPTASGFALFVPSWGARTPSGRYTKEAILTGVARTFPNRDRTVRVVKVVRGSGHRIPAGGAVLQARGPERRTLVAEARPDTTLSLRLGLHPWWDGVADALGGGPVLVRGGVAVYDAGEWFSSYQLGIRHPRTAAGQLADGRILLLVADGRSSLSWGLTNRQLADEMVRLGAVEAMALDAGGSSTMAFDGRVLNRPSDGSERPVADSLQLLYYGVYAPRPRYESFSPNGDGVADVQLLSAKLARPASVRYRLVKPNGRLRWDVRADLGRGLYVRKLAGTRMAEGTWRWVLEATDRRGLASTMQRRFVVNKTLGFVELSKDVLRIWPRHHGRIVVSFRLANRADVVVTIRKPNGRVVRKLVSSTGVAPGTYAAVWNGLNRSGDYVSSGKYVARVRATNSLGRVQIEKGFRVERLNG
jgi:hypothetical protein